MTDERSDPVGHTTVDVYVEAKVAHCRQWLDNGRHSSGIGVS